MRKNYKISDFENDGFLHSYVKNSKIDVANNTTVINLDSADLNNGKDITTCIITITDWWNLEVYEYNNQELKRLI